MPTTSGPAFGPFAAGVGASVGQDDYFDYLGPMLQGDGVNSTAFDGTGLQVFGNSSGLQVLVRPGSALVRGTFYRCVSGTVNLNISSNSSGSARIDRVVLSHDRTSDTLTPQVVMGTPGAGAPALTQVVGGTWQLPLAQVTVASGAVTINPGDVADERQYLPLKLAVCDSRYATPPPDGSQGRVFYDKNPAVADLIISNGARWARAGRQDDNGWDAATVPYHTAEYAKVRQIGPFVNVRFSIEGASDSYGLFVYPRTQAPANEIHLSGTNTVGSVTNVGDPQWQIRIYDDGTACRVDLLPPNDGSSTSPRGLKFQVDHIYLIG